MVHAGCKRPRATLTSRPLCTALHAALLTASVQTLASTVIALVLSSLAESPSLYRMSTKECPLPLSASSLASLPHPVTMHVWDLQSFTVPHGTLYFAHSNQCLALFMVFDAVNENKYGSL